jgi:hypothetical protein
MKRFGVFSALGRAKARFRKPHGLQQHYPLSAFFQPLPNNFALPAASPRLAKVAIKQGGGLLRTYENDRNL